MHTIICTRFAFYLEQYEYCYYYLVVEEGAKYKSVRAGNEVSGVTNNAKRFCIYMGKFIYLSCTFWDKSLTTQAAQTTTNERDLRLEVPNVMLVLSLIYL